MAVSRVIVEDNKVQVIDNTENAIEKALLECAAEFVSQTKRNSRVDTGKTKSSWKAFVKRTGSGFVAYIGSPDENAVWEEFGTGEYALDSSKGRKGSTGERQGGRSRGNKERARQKTKEVRSADGNHCRSDWIIYR